MPEGPQQTLHRRRGPAERCFNRSKGRDRRWSASFDGPRHCRLLQLLPPQLGELVPSSTTANIDLNDSPLKQVEDPAVSSSLVSQTVRRPSSLPGRTPVPQMRSCQMGKGAVELALV